MGRKRLGKPERKTVFIRLPEDEYQKLIKIEGYLEMIREFIKKLIKGVDA